MRISARNQKSKVSERRRVRNASADIETKIENDTTCYDESEGHASGLQNETSNSLGDTARQMARPKPERRVWVIEEHITRQIPSRWTWRPIGIRGLFTHKRAADAALSRMDKSMYRVVKYTPEEI